MRPLTAIGFDADDTLWQNQRYYDLAEARFCQLLSEHAEPGRLGERLLAAERRNIPHYGYGAKGFTLSMIETAIEVTGGQVPAAVVSNILEAGREILLYPVEMLPHVEETLAALAGRFRLVLITKGDLFHQERKLAASGLAELFDAVEIVSGKSAETYRRAFGAHGDGATRAMMGGNSMKSDVLPALEAGSWGVHVPHGLSWEMEHAEPPEGAVRYREIEHLGGLVSVLEGIT